MVMIQIKKVISKWNLQNIIVSLCIMAVCLATHQMQTAKWNSVFFDFSRDSLGVLMAIIIMTNYKWSDFTKYKMPYMIWSVVGILLGVIITPMVIARRAEYLWVDTIVIAVGIFLMGYCIIHTMIRFFVEKYRPKFYLPLFVIWVVMLVLMIFSKSEYLWPECYFVLFLCYYMTKQTPSQRSNVTQGLVNGIILGFVVIQGHALLCRPYDRVRYYGNFCNPNHNCMFLCMCLAAILAKILFLTRDNGKKIVKIFFYLLAGACYSLISMTGSRSGYLATFALTVFFLIAYCKIIGKRVFIKMGLLLVALFVALMPLTYMAVRYIPTIHPHVVFYFQEGYSESRVHSWDERDSEKFISFSELMDQLFGRFKELDRSYQNLFGEATDVIVNDNLQIASNEASLPMTMLAQLEADALTTEAAETDPDKIPALTDLEASNSLVVRYTIYKWYFTHLSLRGMPYDEQGFQLTSSHWIQDTHNIYLDYGINFGYPVMILFMVFIWWGIGRLVKQGLKMRDVEKLTCLLFVLVPPVFGLFEYAWGAGMISTVVFYLAFKEMFSDKCEG